MVDLFMQKALNFGPQNPTERKRKRGTRQRRSDETSGGNREVSFGKLQSHNTAMGWVRREVVWVRR